MCNTQSLQVLHICYPRWDKTDFIFIENKFIKIIELQKEMETRLRSFGSRAEKINSIINAFYESPILSVKDIVAKTGIPDKTTRNLLELMREDNLIKEMTGYERNRLFIFEKYFNLFK